MPCGISAQCTLPITRQLQHRGACHSDCSLSRVSTSSPEAPTAKQVQRIRRDGHDEWRRSLEQAPRAASEACFFAIASQEIRIASDMQTCDANETAAWPAGSTCSCLDKAPWPKDAPRSWCSQRLRCPSIERDWWGVSSVPQVDGRLQLDHMTRPEQAAVSRLLASGECSVSSPRRLRVLMADTGMPHIWNRCPPYPAAVPPRHTHADTHTRHDTRFRRTHAPAHAHIVPPQPRHAWWRRPVRPFSPLCPPSVPSRTPQRPHSHGGFRFF